MKLSTLCLTLLVISIALLDVTNALQALASAELSAQASIEADESMHPLNGQDVVTRSDFSHAEFEGLQALTSSEFWNGLEQELLDSTNHASEQAVLLEKDPKKKAAPAAADKKKPAAADKKKAAADKKKKAADKNKSKKTDKKKKAPAKKDAKKKQKFSLKTDADIEALAKLPVPAEKQKAVLKDQEFDKDTAYEFVNLPGLVKPPTGTDVFLIKAEHTRKALLKRLAKRGIKYMKVLRKLEKAARKNIKEKEWDIVKKINKRTELFEDKMESWLNERDAAFLLRDALMQTDGWREQYNDFVEAVNKQYVDDRKKLVKKLRAQFDKYRLAKKTTQMLHMKKEALRALRTDLESLKGDAMKSFVKKYKQALYKKFGQPKIDKALKKDAKRRKKMLARKKAGKPIKKGPCSGLSYLKKVTKGQATTILVRVAAHLPTVGPYIRAGVIADEAGVAATPIIRRW